MEGDEADGNEDEDDDEIRKTDHEEGEGKAKRVELDPRTIPSVENGSSEIPASRFSVFRRRMMMRSERLITRKAKGKPSGWSWILVQFLLSRMVLQRYLLPGSQSLGGFWE